jgi:hypothetical protein
VKLHDAQINVQAFIANVYGAVDNLAWVWVHERELVNQIPRKRVGLRPHHREVRESFNPEFRDYLSKMDTWFGYITEYRDALAHRIPLYIPPGSVLPKDRDSYNDLAFRMNTVLSMLDVEEYDRLSAEQNKLLVFQPFITHSVRETTARLCVPRADVGRFLIRRGAWPKDTH